MLKSIEKNIKHLENNSCVVIVHLVSGAEQSYHSFCSIIFSLIVCVLTNIRLIFKGCCCGALICHTSSWKDIILCVRCMCVPCWFCFFGLGWRLSGGVTLYVKGGNYRYSALLQCNVVDLRVVVALGTYNWI